jgi:hypothetical protein
MAASSRQVGGPLQKQISITSADVLQTYNRLLEQIQDPSVAASLEEVRQEQSAAEAKLSKITSLCPVPKLSNLRDHIPGIRAAELRDFLIKQPQNPVVMQEVMCLVDSLFYTSPYDVGSLYLNNRIRLYIHNLRQVGADSGSGYTLSADFENVADMFIIKTAESPVTDDLRHELMVGLYGTNRLRQYIPNFAYVYGGFKCSPPLVDPETKKVVTWCLHNDNAVNYILYENIIPSITLAKYIETCTGSEFVNAYIQVVYALRMALKVIDYTHYNLHNQNVYLRSPRTDQSDKKIAFQIPYETERGVEYITTQLVPTLTNYEYAHFTTDPVIDSAGHQIKDAQHLGRSGFVPFSIFPYRSWIMHDVYKLLMFSLMSASKHNNTQVLTEATKIFRFFNQTDDPTVVMNEEWPVRFAFPLNDQTNLMSINDLAHYIRTVCNCDFISPDRSPIPVLDCEKMCVKEDDFLTRIGAHPGGPIGVPDNILEFYDIEVRLHNTGRNDEKERLGAAFPYRQAIKAHLLKMNQLVTELDQLRRKLKLFDIGTMTVSEALTYNTMMLVRAMYIAVGTIIDRIVELRFYYQVGTAVARTYHDEASIATMSNLITQFNTQIKPALDDAKIVFDHNRDVINQARSNEMVQLAVDRDARLKWYWEGRDLYDVIFRQVKIIIE